MSDKKCFQVMRNGNIIYFIGNSVSFKDESIEGVNSFTVEISIKDNDGNVISSFCGECKGDVI